MDTNSIRFDLRLIQQWVEPGSRVLDLGCGDGALLQALARRGINGLGVEIDSEQITTCLRRGVDVIEQDLNKGLANFGNDSFDVVMMTHALQTLRSPHQVIDEMLRVGQQCIVTFPNFGHWRSRWYLLRHGRMPHSDFLPYTWYDTPNIHFFTVKDFEDLCDEKAIKILNRITVTAQTTQSTVTARWPNLFALTAAYRLTK